MNARKHFRHDCRFPVQLKTASGVEGCFELRNLSARGVLLRTDNEDFVLGSSSPFTSTGEQVLVTIELPGRQSTCRVIALARWAKIGVFQDEVGFAVSKADARFTNLVRHLTLRRYERLANRASPGLNIAAGNGNNAGAGLVRAA